MASPLAQVPEEERGLLRKARQPAWTQPMLATLTDDHFSSSGWLYERKLDGVRLLAFRKGRELRLMSRNRQPANATYPELEAPLLQQASRDFIVDGEVVAGKGDVASFRRLQERMGIRDRGEAERRAGRVAAYYYVFDLLHLDGHDLTALPLRTRKAVLRSALETGSKQRVCFTPHRVGRGEAFLEEVCGSGWEGLIAKRAASPYQHKRSRDWLKFKCSARQELVIGGFTEPQGSRQGFGALLVGYYDKKGKGQKLRYAGKVGTGYNEKLLKELRARMDALERKEPPFDGDGLPRKAHWVQPRLVGEFGFTEWTRDGKLRHPRFLGLRTDKPARQVVKEEPA